MESSVVDYVPDIQHVQAGMGSSVVDYSDIPCNCRRADLSFHKLVECSHLPYLVLLFVVWSTWLAVVALLIEYLALC